MDFPSANPSKRFEKGALVLVTGANGYIASHVVDILLREGYRVRGSLRTEMPKVNDFFDAKYGKGQFETCVVPAMENDMAFKAAVKDVAGIIHLASNLSVDTDPNKVIPQAIAGTLNILKAAAGEASVRSVVLTSSCVAAYLPERGTSDVVYEGTWNENSVRAAWSNDTPIDARGFQVYAASKVESEKEAWKWVDANKPQFAFSTILPPFNVGELRSPDFHGSTMHYVRSLLEGNDDVMRLLRPQWHINVRDDAELHIAVLLDSNVQHRRAFPFGRPFSWSDLIELLRKLCPENTMLPPPPDNDWRDAAIIAAAEWTENLHRSFFGRKYIGLEESIAAGISDIM